MCVTAIDVEAHLNILLSVFKIVLPLRISFMVTSADSHSVIYHAEQETIFR